MGMKLLYITNDTEVARVADGAGVDEIFVDLETKSKKERQAGRNTVISNHTIDDVGRIKSVVSSATVLVRCNPVGDWTPEEVDSVISAGADTIMLPFFRSAAEVSHFLACVDRRVDIRLLVETPDAVEDLDTILSLPEVNRIHIGLNDLHIAYNSHFMFEPFMNDKLVQISRVCRRHNVAFGIGGIAHLGSKLQPSPQSLLAEHRRLGSDSVILSRSFLDLKNVGRLADFSTVFESRVRELRDLELELKAWDDNEFLSNHLKLKKVIARVVEDLKG